MTSPACPNCQSTNTCDILYGLPDYTDELGRDLDSGKLHLGGCIVEDDSADYHCNACNKDFDS